MPSEAGFEWPTPAKRTLDMLVLVEEERKRQDDKWGEQNHDLPTWLAILAEEVGEFAEAVLILKFGEDYGASELDHAMDEITQVAAVAVAIMEYLKRREG